MVNSYESTTDRTVGLVILFLLQTRTSHHSLTQSLTHTLSPSLSGPALEAVWRHMFRQTPPQLQVFELWYGDELVAADFGHPVCLGMLYYKHMYELSLQQVPPVSGSTRSSSSS